MRICKSILMLIILSAFTTNTNAQEASEKHPNNKISLNGKEYYMHIVRKGETLSAISRAYEVPVDSIIADNPQLTYQIYPDQYIKIRIKPDEKKDEKFSYHLITKGDTPYNIAKRYGISIDELYKLNPGAELGIKIGDRLRIKSAETNKNTVQTIENTATDTAFILHKVDKKETLFGIARKYHTTPTEIERLNPSIAGRSIQVGEMLKIHVPEAVADEISDGNFDLYKVQKQETIYGITHKYQISEKALLKLNPDLKNRGVQEGELIKVPKGTIVAEQQQSTEKEEDKPKTNEIEQQRIAAYEADNKKMHEAQNAHFDLQKTYKVAFFLPLYYTMNDTIGWGMKQGKVYEKSKNFIEFYAGAMLALNDLRRQGVSFDVQIIDTKGDSVYISNYMRTHDLSDYDMFIGPAFSSELQAVGDYAWENQINIVSPLSVKSTFIDHNPYAFQVCPTLEIQMKYMADFLNQIDTKNYIVIHNGNVQEQDYISEFKRQLYSSISNDNLDQVRYNEYYYFNTSGDILNSAFLKGRENIVIIPSTDRAFVTDVMGKLNGYSYEYNIKIFGQPRWKRFESIDIDNFHNTNTHYLSNSYIDYNKQPITDFVRNYRNLMNIEPDLMAFQGYDITMFFCSALNKFGKDFRHYIMYHQAPLLQTEFNFVPYSSQGGYQNTAIYILNYAKDYSIKKIASYPIK